MGKGTATRARILEEAFHLASREGLTGLTIGSLADQLGMSKSGLFAHFKSKEELQRQVLERAGERFREIVLQPALGADAGLPRLEALFRRWLNWVPASGVPGGCVILAATAELDDRPGEVRDRLVGMQRALRDTIARMVKGAIEAGHFRTNVDPEQMAFDLVGVMAAYHVGARLLEDRRSLTRAKTAFARLVQAAKA